MITSDIEDEIQSIKTQLIEKYHPQKIVIFGSYVKREFDTEKSDLDFLIIKKDVPHYGRQRIYELDRLINYKIASDFIVYTPEEIQLLIKLKDPFISLILEEGKILKEDAYEAKEKTSKVRDFVLNKLKKQ